VAEPAAAGDSGGSAAVAGELQAVGRHLRMEGLAAVGLKLVDWLTGTFRGLRRVRALAHHGAMIITGEPCVFVNVTNLSRDRAVEVTHVGFDTRPPISVVNLDRPLPRRLDPDESWETWLPLEFVPQNQRSQILTLGRVRLSNGKTLSTRENRTVPHAGHVPGP
jgi:hypothetical protein